MQHIVDCIYENFISLVVLNRHLDRETVETVAEGRVWTGVQAQQHGLIDRLGGLDTSLRLAKEAAHLPVDSTVTLVQLPQPKSLPRQLFWLAKNIFLISYNYKTSLFKHIESLFNSMILPMDVSDDQLLQMTPIGIGNR
jgi:ClpP class serine protease